MDKAGQLRLLAAEIRNELARIQITVEEIELARKVLAKESSRLEIYGTAALLETFYTGLEKAFFRISRHFGMAPTGTAWHRDLLDSMAIDIPKVRPSVLAEETAQRLEEYLSFRHRFRNLYLFELDINLLYPLVERVSVASSLADSDLKKFIGILEAMAEMPDKLA
jgi:hypothetical protein